MILQVVSLYDKKSMTFKNPFFVLRVEVATRSLASAVRSASPENDVATYPHDFALYHLGTFNDESGQFQQLAQPVVIIEAAALRAAEQIPLSLPLSPLST